MNNSEYNFTLKTKVGKWEVAVDPIQGYGYFERETDGAGGGLWFGEGELQDYDGVFSLPRDVGTAIESFGYRVDDNCY